MAETELSCSLREWQERIGAWHRMAFPWAKLPHIMEKLAEERREAVLSWGIGDGNVADELADCMICTIAAMEREGIDVDAALASKFERVQQKYASEQPAPHMAKMRR